MLSLIEQIRDSPSLATLHEEISRILRDEATLRAKFLNDITPEDKAEFINGVAIFHSPARDRHTAAVGRLNRVMSSYVDILGLGLVRAEKALVSLKRNDYEPDVCFFGAAKAAGIAPDTMRYPAPDLVVEVLSPSTEKNDRGVKFEDYAAHGVTEYWIVDPDAEILEQYLLAGDRYELALKARDGHVESKALAGMRLPVRALFDDAENVVALRGIVGDK